MKSPLTLQEIKASILEWDVQIQIVQNAQARVSGKTGFIITREDYNFLRSANLNSSPASDVHYYFGVHENKTFVYLIDNISDSEIGFSSDRILQSELVSFSMPSPSQVGDSPSSPNGISPKEALNRFNRWQEKHSVYFEQNVQSGIFQAFHAAMVDLKTLFEMGMNNVHCVLSMREDNHPELIFWGEEFDDISYDTEDVTFPIPPFQNKAHWELFNQAGIAL